MDTTEHCGVPYVLPVRHGGLNGDRPGTATVDIHEQDHDHTTKPVIAVTLTVDQAEQTVWLTPAETRGLRRTLDDLLHHTGT